MSEVLQLSFKDTSALLRQQQLTWAQHVAANDQLVQGVDDYLGDLGGQKAVMQRQLEIKVDTQVQHWHTCVTQFCIALTQKLRSLLLCSFGTIV